MLLEQFQKIMQIDAQISKLHNELEKLYKARAEIIGMNEQDVLQNQQVESSPTDNTPPQNIAVDSQPSEQP